MSDYDSDPEPSPDFDSGSDSLSDPEFSPLALLLFLGIAITALFVGKVALDRARAEAEEKARQIAKVVDFATKGYSLSCDRFREIVAARNKNDQVYCDNKNDGEFVAFILSTKTDNSQVIPTKAYVTFNCNTACLSWVEGGQSATYRDPMSLAEVKDEASCRTSLKRSLQVLMGTDKQHLVPVLDEAGLQQSALDCKAKSLLQQQRMEAGKRASAEKEAARAAITFTQKEILDFRRIDDGFRIALQKEPYGPSSEILESVAKGRPYLMAEVDLDGDGVPEVVLRHPQCDAKWCDIFVVKQMPGKGYQHISRHKITGTIGVTNEHVCGFRALLDANKVAIGAIRAEPMNYLKGIDRAPCDF